MINKVITCDKCGKEIVVIGTIFDKVATINLIPIGQPRSDTSVQRIDLCEECYQNFVNWLESNI